MLRRAVAVLGPLRVGLVLITALVILAAPFAEVTAELVTGWALWPAVIAPALMPILVFVLPLDMTMSRLIMADREPAARGRYRIIIRVELALLALMLLAWTPFAVELFRA